MTYLDRSHLFRVRFTIFSLIFIYFYILLLPIVIEAVIAQYLNIHLQIQTGFITTNVVSWIPAHGVVCRMQHHVIKSI